MTDTNQQQPKAETVSAQFLSRPIGDQPPMISLETKTFNATFPRHSLIGSTRRLLISEASSIVTLNGQTPNFLRTEQKIDIVPTVVLVLDELGASVCRAAGASLYDEDAQSEDEGETDLFDFEKAMLSSQTPYLLSDPDQEHYFYLRLFGKPLNLVDECDLLENGLMKAMMASDNEKIAGSPERWVNVVRKSVETTRNAPVKQTTIGDDFDMDDTGLNGPPAVIQNHVVQMDRAENAEVLEARDKIDRALNIVIQPRLNKSIKDVLQLHSGASSFEQLAENLKGSAVEISASEAQMAEIVAELQTKGRFPTIG